MIGKKNIGSSYTLIQKQNAFNRFPLDIKSLTSVSKNIRLETKSCRISYGKLTIKYDRT